MIDAACSLSWENSQGRVDTPKSDQVAGEKALE